MGVHADLFTRRTPEREAVKQVLRITLLSTHLRELHKDVNERVHRRREMGIAAHNKDIKIVTLHFLVGSFVLVCKGKRTAH